MKSNGALNGQSESAQDYRRGHWLVSETRCAVVRKAGA
jgi:hypothetical protein